MSGLAKQKVIELKYIARALNQAIGPKYNVIVNASTKLTSDGRTMISLQATRIPFALTGIGSETLDVKLEAWTPADNPMTRDEVLADLNGLIGHQSGQIEAGDKLYNYASFLQFEKPIGNPNMDTGTWRYLMALTGTMLISDVVTGAVISNAVFTRLYLGEPGVTALQGFVPVMNSETGHNYSSETYPFGNRNKADVRHILQGHSFSVTSLVLNRPIDDAILRLIDSGGERGINDPVYVERIYPNFTSTKKCRVLEGRVTEQAGVYLSYTLALQEVP